MSPGVVTAGSPRVVTPESPTTNSNQETVLQETENVVVAVAQDLEHFGIAKSAVTKLMQDYPAAYIREKLEMGQGLVAAGSALVSQNPAGWLRRAIEEDYAPPRISQRHRQRAADTQGGIPAGEGGSLVRDGRNHRAAARAALTPTGRGGWVDYCGCLEQSLGAIEGSLAPGGSRSTAQGDNACTGNRHRSSDFGTQWLCLGVA
jgi:hypothetical protein